MKINIKVLLKSMSYLMIPTIVVFFMLFMYFLDVNEFLEFITAKNWFASILRVILMIVEVLFTWYVYSINMGEEELRIIAEKEKQRLENIENGEWRKVQEKTSYITQVYRHFEHQSDYEVYLNKVDKKAIVTWQ